MTQDTDPLIWDNFIQLKPTLSDQLRKMNASEQVATLKIENENSFFSLKPTNFLWEKKNDSIIPWNQLHFRHKTPLKESRTISHGLLITGQPQIPISLCFNILNVSRETVAATTTVVVGEILTIDGYSWVISDEPNSDHLHYNS